MRAGLMVVTGCALGNGRGHRILGHILVHPIRHVHVHVLSRIHYPGMRAYGLESLDLPSPFYLDPSSLDLGLYRHETMEFPCHLSALVGPS